MARDKTHPAWGVYDEYRNARYSKKVHAIKLAETQKKNFGIEVALALFTPTSAIAGFFFLQTQVGQGIWQTCLAISAVLAAINPFLKYTEKISDLKNGLAKYTMLDHDYNVLTIQIREKRKYDDDLKKRFQEILNAKAHILDSSGDLGMSFEERRKIQAEVNTELPPDNFYLPEES